MLGRLGALFHAGWAVLSRRDRTTLVWLLPAMVVAAFLETIGLALVIPLVGAIAEPDRLAALHDATWVRAITGEVGRGALVALFAVVVAVFYTVKNGVLLVTTYAVNRFIMSAVSAGSCDLLGKYLAAPYVFHLQHNSAELIRNVNMSTENTFRGVIKPALQVFSEIMIIAGFSAVLLLADPVVTLSGGAFLAAVMLLFFWSTHRIVTRWGRRLQNLARQSLQQLNQALGSLKEVRILQRTGYFLASFAQMREETSDLHVKHQTLVELPRLGIETLLVVTLVVTISITLLRGDNAQHILPLLAVYAYAGFRLMPAFTRLILMLNTIRFHSPALLDIVHHHAALRQLAVTTEASREVERIQFRDSLVLENVSYQFPDASHAAISGISLTIRPGQSIGLVGSSGAGKTTLANLILGLIVPTTGRIVVDGITLGEEVSPWQRLIGYVPQTIYLLDDTVRCNVAIGVPDGEIDDARIESALRLAQLWDSVRAMPKGEATALGENGVRISGGQRQRIGIARALYHSPEVLVMDEATSALDGETEREITAAIDVLKAQMTVIVIAHRLSTVRHCNTVIYLEQGRIIDQGTFDELRERNVTFRRLVELGSLMGAAA